MAKSIIFFFIIFLPLLSHAKSPQCRTSCGQIPINYPFGVDDGCGSPYYRRTLACSAAGALELRTPSGRYPVINISYSDPHILVSDPSMWTCRDAAFRPPRAFSLDSSTHFRLSPQNDYLFFNCSPNDVVMEAKPALCDRFPDQCDSTCDTASYLCRHVPECEGRVRSTCCAYYPKGSESLRMMLRHCSSYASVYWRSVGGASAYRQVPEYGIRVDFDIPVTTKCLWCEDDNKGGGVCGYDVGSRDFLCLCGKGNANATTYCKDGGGEGSSRAMVAGTVSAVSVAGVFVGVGVWYLRKMRAKAPVTHGVQTNENRLF